MIKYTLRLAVLIYRGIIRREKLFLPFTQSEFKSDIVIEQPMVKMEHNKKSCHADLVLNTFRSMMPGNGKTKIVTF